MRIGLNLVHAHFGIGGGWNYIRNTVSILQEFDRDNEYVAYCTANSRELVRPQNNFKIVDVAISGTNRVGRVLYENVVLPWRAKRDNLDIIHWFANTKAFYCRTPAVVTVHDLLAFEPLKNHLGMSRLFLRIAMPRSIGTAAMVSPVSIATASAIEVRFGMPIDRMVVVHSALGEEFAPAPETQVEKFREKFNLPARFWVYVAHYCPQKNHDGLVRAYALLKKRRPQCWPLVLRGEKWGADQQFGEMLVRAGVEGDVIWLPRLSYEEMPLLYSCATALVFPSLFEGGGIPVMEAMGCGCPAIVSDIPTSHEFGGDAVGLFDPTSIESIAEAMQKFEEDDSLRKLCRDRGLVKAEEYRPRRIFSRLMEAYSKAATWK